MHLDHCHKTGVVRGVLCVNCNTALGHFEENTDLVKEAIVKDFNLLPVGSKKGMSKFGGYIDIMKKAVQYLQQT